MAASTDYDVVVVGAGLAGASAAWHLTRRGHAVLVLEQFDLGHHLGSSHGTSRIYRRAYPDPFYVALTGQVGEHWQELERRGGTTLRTATGGVDSGRRRDPEGLVGLLLAQGVDAELVPPQEAARRWPGLLFAAPVMFHPEAGHLDSDATVRAMLRLAVEGGAEVRERTPMTRLEQAHGGVVVHTDGQTIRAGQVVVCAGAWLPEVTPQLPELRLPAWRIKQQEVFHFPRLDPATPWPTLVHKDDVQLYALPSGADGGPAPAMKVAQFDSESTTTATARDGIIDDRARRVVRDHVARWMPGLDPSPVAEHSCLFTMTPDEDFVIDRFGDVVVCSPCSGHGAKFAPLIGDLVADLVAGAPPQPRFAFR